MSDEIADPPRARGRPRGAEARMEVVCVKLPVKHYDRLVKIANERREPLSKVVRTLIAGRLSPHEQR